MITADLHIHTDISDGSLSTEEVIKEAKENGLTHIAITNHDTVKGLEEANQMYERHTTIANFFKKIGVSEDIALKDACRMEHHLSDESFNAIKKLIEELDK